MNQFVLFLLLPESLQNALQWFEHLATYIRYLSFVPEVHWIKEDLLKQEKKFAHAICSYQRFHQKLFYDKNPILNWHLQKTRWLLQSQTNEKIQKQDHEHSIPRLFSESCELSILGRSSDLLSPRHLPIHYKQWQTSLRSLWAYSSGNCSGFTPDSLLIPFPETMNGTNLIKKLAENRFIDS